MSIRATTALLLLAASRSGHGIQIKHRRQRNLQHRQRAFHRDLSRVQHLGAGNFYGRFNELEGTIDWDAEGGPSFDVSINIESVDSGNEALDKHLKNADFFDAKQFPTMTFQSTSASKRWATTGRSWAK